jgi:hypothetical protein
MRYTIQPFIGVGEVKFGKDRNKIREFLGMKYEAKNDIDYYLEDDIILQYNENNELIFIELIATSDVIFSSHNLSMMKYENIRTIFDAISENIDEEDNFGVNYLDLGFGVSINIENKLIKTTSIFIKGYWDDFE